jgi:hypothetical protein
MAGLIEISALFKNCARRRGLSGVSSAEAERRCQDDEPSPMPLYRPPFVTPSAGSAEQAPEGPQEPRRGPDDEGEDTDPLGESAAFMGPSRSHSRWMGRNLTPGTVPAWRDPRTEAHIWADEMTRVGQRPPFNRDGWVEHATRMGLSPDGIEQGWDYIERVFSKKYEERRLARVVEELKGLLGEGDPWSGGPPPYGGYYATFPHRLKMKTPQGSAPSFPFHTKAAEKVYAAAVKIIARDPGIDAEGAYRQAMGKVGVNPFEMTPEDEAIMGIALHWEITGKEARPEPPRVSSQGRPTSGMKGTQISYGREIMPRGAP